MSDHRPLMHVSCKRGHYGRLSPPHRNPGSGQNFTKRDLQSHKLLKGNSIVIITQNNTIPILHKTESQGKQHS